MAQYRHTDPFARLKGFFLSSELLASADVLVMMVSGGSDSTALLHLVNDVFGKTSAHRKEHANDAFREDDAHHKELIVLHINHQLRGTESDEDESFVCALCDLLSLDCRTERVDVTAYAAETGSGLEQAGRVLRYEKAKDTLRACVEKLPDGNKQGLILTAHTADDRAETLLQRLIVGGGSGSLSSIPQKNGNIFRPLLNVTRQELQEWLIFCDCPVNGCLWREDATNRDTAYSRAFVRHAIMPLLMQKNPRIVETLNRTADVLSAESVWLDEQAEALLPLSSQSFEAPLPLLRRAVYLACNHAIEQLSPEARITFDHVELIVQNGNRNGFACQIPGGIQVRNVRGSLCFTKAKPPRHNPGKSL